MGLINYKDIDFNKSINKENKIINFNGSEIQIVNYLSAQDKYDLTMITLQKSFENNIYNYAKLKMYFALHLVYLYTNIIFDATDKADEEGLYDILKQSGLIDKIIDYIPDEEKDELWQNIMFIKSDMEKYHNSFSYFANDIIEDLNEKINKGIEIMKSLNFEEYLKNFSDLKNNPELIIAE